MHDREFDLPFGWVISTDVQHDGDGNFVVVAYEEDTGMTIIGRSAESHDQAFSNAVEQFVSYVGGNPDVVFAS